MFNVKEIGNFWTHLEKLIKDSILTNLQNLANFHTISIGLIKSIFEKGGEYI